MDAYLRYTGILHDDGSFEPGVGWTTTRIRFPAEPNSRHVVEALDESGAVLDSAAATITAIDDPALAGHLAGELVVYLPFAEAARSVRLRRGDEILHETDLALRAPILGQPEADVTESRLVVRWSVEHDRPLVHNIFIADGRARTFAIATGVVETGLEFDASTLPGEGECRVAVLATDGLRSAHEISEPFELPRRPSRLTIMSPAQDQAFPPDSPLTLLACGQDPSGDDLPERSVTWTVDEREVGRGRWILAVDALEPGEHRITVTSDANDQRVIESVAIRIRERTEEEESWARIAVAMDRDGRTAADERSTF
jgi:hypothetical protein